MKTCQFPHNIEIIINADLPDAERERLADEIMRRVNAYDDLLLSLKSILRWEECLSKPRAVAEIMVIAKAAIKTAEKGN